LNAANITEERENIMKEEFNPFNEASLNQNKFLKLLLIERAMQRNNHQ